MDEVRLLQHKIAAAKRAWQIMRDPKTVFLDSETTGVHDAYFVELAIINRKGLPLINQRLDPMAEIEVGATRVHGIEAYQLVGQPRFFEIVEDVVDCLEGKRLVIYNAKFDWGVLRDEIGRLNYSSDPFFSLKKLLKLKGIHCAMLIYAQFRGEWNSYYGNFKWQKLVAACERFDVQVPLPAHSALGDTLRTLEVMRSMAAWYEYFSSQYKELVA